MQCCVQPIVVRTRLGPSRVSEEARRWTFDQPSRALARLSVTSDLFLGSFRVVLPAMRWIWIDKFLEFRSGQFARAIKNLTLAEEHLHDHFPGYPVMPASLIIEGLAQTGGILVGEAGGFAEKVVLAKIPRAEFYGVACAGDQLIYEVTLTDLRSRRGRRRLQGVSGRRIACRSRDRVRPSG